MDNHIYDSFQDSPSFSNIKNRNNENRTVSKSHLPPMRVTEL